MLIFDEVAQGRQYDIFAHNFIFSLLLSRIPIILKKKKKRILCGNLALSYVSQHSLPETSDGHLQVAYFVLNFECLSFTLFPTIGW